MDGDIKVTGFDKALEMLRELKQSIVNKVLKKAVSESLNPGLAAAKSLVPKDTGALKKSIIKKVRILKRKVAFGIVGPRKDEIKITKGKRKGEVVKAHKYAHLVEFGHIIVPRGKGKESAALLNASRRKKGTTDEQRKEAADARASLSIGNVPPRPFLRPAFSATKGQATTIFQSTVVAEVNKIWTGGKADEQADV